MVVGNWSLSLSLSRTHTHSHTRTHARTHAPPWMCRVYQVSYHHPVFYQVAWIVIQSLLVHLPLGFHAASKCLRGKHLKQWCHTVYLMTWLPVVLYRNANLVIAAVGFVSDGTSNNVRLFPPPPPNIITSTTATATATAIYTLTASTHTHIHTHPHTSTHPPRTLQAIGRPG
jgi:hypothetical protein